MALSSDALTTLEALKTYLQISSDENDSFIESLIEAVSAHFKAYTGRNLTARDYSSDPLDQAYDPDNAILDGSGHADLILPQYPLVSLSTLMIEGTEVDQASAGDNFGWTADRPAGVISLINGFFPRGRQNVRLAYQAGYQTVPADLSQAALEQTATRFQESAAGHGRLGISARTLADGSISYTQQPLLPQVREVLDRYRNRSLL
ncbi:MAG: head-tail connector protein [Desulfarculaceae bacterium]|jgi:hypothetical protein